MSRRHADYVYRNADDSVRVRIFRNLGRWDFDTFRRDGSEIDQTSPFRRVVRFRDACQDAAKEIRRAHQT